MLAKDAQESPPVFLLQDFNMVDLEDFRYSGSNITGVQLVDPRKPAMKQVAEEWMIGELRFGRTPAPHLQLVTVLSPLSHTFWGAGAVSGEG